MRKGLSLDELGDLLERPFNATLATYRRDGSVLLSPVWHEWREGGFSIITGIDDVKLRHIERDGRAVAVVADNDLPYRGIEISAVASIIRDTEFAQETFRRIATRYLGEERARAYIDREVGRMLVIRLEPGRLRTWDFADDYALVGAGTE
jgi:PPOX class probable F420-dependent enzyme